MQHTTQPDVTQLAATTSTTTYVTTTRHDAMLLLVCCYYLVASSRWGGGIDRLRGEEVLRARVLASAVMVGVVLRRRRMD
ncbi:hypothetical protein M0802_009105 [Mischocyttarus mexicanus]|nr:hypothetical protein M0802_009105 [Mischocyttarus mexicanus]